MVSFYRKKTANKNFILYVLIKMTLYDTEWTQSEDNNKEKKTIRKTDLIAAYLS